MNSPTEGKLRIAEVSPCDRAEDAQQPPVAKKPPGRRRTAAAQYLEDQTGAPCSPNYLAKHAVIGGGPVFRKFGRIPLYDDEDLDAWAESRLSPPMRSTSDSGEPQQ